MGSVCARAHQQERRPAGAGDVEIEELRARRDDGPENAVAVVAPLDGERRLDGPERVQPDEHTRDRERREVSEVHRVRETNSLKRL